MKTCRRLSCFLSLLACLPAFGKNFPAADDWPWWRRPSLNGVAVPGQKTPISWCTRRNVIWKALVPGRGHGTPTVVGNHVVRVTADET